jgi:hypothetical protein
MARGYPICCAAGTRLPRGRNDGVSLGSETSKDADLAVSLCAAIRASAAHRARRSRCAVGERGRVHPAVDLVAGEQEQVERPATAQLADEVERRERLHPS